MKRHHRARHHVPGRLFAESRTASAPPDACVAEIDGAARGNPGPASYAVVVRHPDGQIIAKLKRQIGQATNNVAEYYALIAALDYARTHRISKLRVRSDSELLVRQMKGHYRVKSLSLRQLHDRARRLAQSLVYFSVEHISREQNREADTLANAALDSMEGSSGKFVSGKLLTDESLKDEQEYSRAPRHIRARYRHGALYPAEPLDLAEDEEVEITVHLRRTNART